MFLIKDTLFDAQMAANAMMATITKSLMLIYSPSALENGRDVCRRAETSYACFQKTMELKFRTEKDWELRTLVL